MTIADLADLDKLPLMLTVGVAGAMIGLSRISSCRPAARGELRTVWVGGRLLVPTLEFLVPSRSTPQPSTANLAADPPAGRRRPPRRQETGSPMSRSDRAAGKSQQMARVNVSEEEWLAFRVLVLESRQSIADRLGDLVRRELAAWPQQSQDAGLVDSNDTDSEEPGRREMPVRQRVRLSDVELLSWPPRVPRTE